MKNKINRGCGRDGERARASAKERGIEMIEKMMMISPVGGRALPGDVDIHNLPVVVQHCRKKDALVKKRKKQKLGSGGECERKRNGERTN